ncbi:hypothetical protein D3C85_1481450 [compost metagenome]
MIGLTIESESAGLQEMNPVTAIYPNPFSEVLIFKTTQTVDLQLTDLSGRILKTIPSVNGTYELNTSDLSGGVILLSTYVNGKVVATQRVVKR